jgi:hypothetical protein
MRDGEARPTCEPQNEQSAHFISHVDIALSYENVVGTPSLAIEAFFLRRRWIRHIYHP